MIGVGEIFDHLLMIDRQRKGLTLFFGGTIESVHAAPRRVSRTDAQYFRSLSGASSRSKSENWFSELQEKPPTDGKLAAFSFSALVTQ